jgi:ATP-dependent exoDNAse (exonuclease V) alpha subunit
MYYFFREKMAELRDNNACTVHASQGSTYDRVYIDYKDIVKGKGQTVGNKARMLYVALSRAKEEIYIYKKD